MDFATFDPDGFDDELVLAIELLQGHDSSTEEEVLCNYASLHPAPSVRAAALKAIFVKWGAKYQSEFIRISGEDPAPSVRQTAAASLDSLALRMPSPEIVAPPLAGPPAAAPGAVEVGSSPAQFLAPVAATPI